MAIDVQSLIEEMTGAATTAAKGHAQDLKAFIEDHAERIAEGVAAIESDKLAGLITADDAQFSYDEMKEEAKTEAAAIDVAVKTAAQDAINAALDVAAAAASKALGIALV